MPGNTHSLRRPDEAELSRILAHARAWGLDAENPDGSRWLAAFGPAGRLLGFGRLRPRPGFQELCTLGVLPAVRGRGLGLRLSRALIALAEKEPLWLLTALRGFFERLGFVPDDAAPEPLLVKLREGCCSLPGHEGARAYRLAGPKLKVG